MFLEYEWTNPAAAAAAAAAMLLFSTEENQQVIHDHRQAYYNHQFGHDLAGDFLCQPTTVTAQTLPTSGLFPMPPTSSSSSSSLHGLALPLAPARLGLNLGVRTYFSSEERMMVAGRVSRRRPRLVRCQAEGCGFDLTHAKHYHRRHKVCEFHSKASIVITAGLSQRFCQQCSRFHVLAEFDQGKRSCRKRLAEHNRRRRKSHDLITNSSPASEKTPVVMTEKVLFTTSNKNAEDDYDVLSVPKPQDQETNAAPMMLGLGFNSDESGDLVVVPAPAGLSGSSSTGTLPCRFPVELGDFSEHHENHNHFPSWDDGEDGSSIRALFS